jgi:hypothetical protein
VEDLNAFHLKKFSASERMMTDVVQDIHVPKVKGVVLPCVEEQNALAQQEV